VKKIAVYCRVSTGHQDHASQEPDLQNWLDAYANGSYPMWFRETFTGKTMDRPEMRRLEGEISRGRISKLVVWRLDRLGRTAGELIRFLDSLVERGVVFVSVKDNIDSMTASGRLMRTILAGFAEYEREIIRERIMAGISRAHAAGKRWGGSKKGRRTVLKPGTLQAVAALLEVKMSKIAIARQLGIGRSSVFEAVKILRKGAA